MFRTSLLFIMVAALGMAGCQQVKAPGSVAVVAPAETPKANDWRLIASDVDAARIGRIDASWTDAIADVRAHGGAKALAVEGELLDPKAALPRPTPPPGVYHCRVVRIGLTQAKGGKSWEAFKPFYCFVAVEGPLLTFTKGSGTHRPGGRLWDDTDTRMVFLGSVSADAKDPLPAYGDNPMSNQVGVVERIGEFRWRMVIPASTPEAKLDVIELLPDAPAPTPGLSAKPAA